MLGLTDLFSLETNNQNQDYFINPWWEIPFLHPFTEEKQNYIARTIEQNKI